MHPSDRTRLTLASTLLGCVLPFALWSQKANEQWRIRKGIEATEQQSEISSQIALGRAKYCLRLNFQTPLSNGVTVFYYGTNRPLPAGQTVCDQYGNTATVGDAGRAVDIQSAPPEQINQLLESRKDGNW